MTKFQGTSLLLGFMILGLGACATAPGAGGSHSGTVRYEAEAGQIFNSSHHKADVPAGTERQSFYSGGLAAGGLNKETPVADVLPDWSNVAYVRFTVQAAGGDYVVKVHYNGDDDKTILVRVNEGKAAAVPVPRMGDGTWNVMWDKSIPVTLKPGANTVDLSGTVGNAGWMNIDYIEVAPSAP